RFTTYETAELRMPQIVKTAGEREDFSSAKLRTGFQRALHKRPVTTELVDAAITRIEQKVLALGEREIDSRRLGEMVMEAVRALERAGANARGATAYVTLEPCAHQGRTGPCTEVLIRAGVSRVVAALEDPFPQVNGRGVAKLRDAGIRVDTGLMADDAREVH